MKEVHKKMTSRSSTISCVPCIRAIRAGTTKGEEIIQEQEGEKEKEEEKERGLTGIATIVEAMDIDFETATRRPRIWQRAKEEVNEEERMAALGEEEEEMD